MSHPVVLLVDTMLFLHFKPIEQVDWRALLKAQNIDGADIRIVVARVTMRELDKHKNEHRTPSIRTRAARVLKDLEAWFVDAREGKMHEVRPGIPVTVQLQDFGSDFDFTAHSLRVGSADDELIAAMLVCRAQTPDARLVLASDDGGPRMTAQFHGMDAVRPNADDRLPSEEEALVKENTSLRRELLVLKNKEPQLTLAFVAGPNMKAEDRIAVYVSGVGAEPVQAWGEAMRDAARRAPEILAPIAPKSGDQTKDTAHQAADTNAPVFDLATLVHDAGHRMMNPAIMPEEYERYAEERVTYLDGYQTSLRELWELWNKDRRSFLLALYLENTGTTVAEDIEVRFQIPEGLEAELISQWEIEEPLPAPPDVPYVPDPPAAPARPRTRMQVMSITAQAYANSPYLRNFSHAHPKPPRGLVLRRAAGYEADEQLARLKHGYVYPLQVLRLWFPMDVKPRAFTISYQIDAANMAVPVNDKLHVIVTSDS